ncbi:hypothetical protein LTR82_016322 [Friedmanniomyces endolithicus]|uniref:WW domain-containing protein n=1 Tax=Friedmanniomyces endolithicus TaxID=329885 RepID=A0AAN6F6Q1_9PEZI|nr:hypothetical protein LTR82_016322 [Friedmanniomyces endolithicus]
MESPNKRVRPSPVADEDFVPLGGDNEEPSDKFGYSNGNDDKIQSIAPSGPRVHQDRQANINRQHDSRFDRRNAQDRPKTKHVLPGHEPWVLVKTELGRRFVHNVETKQSLWHVPDGVWPAVKQFENWEKQQKEKEANARWAEEELRKMREVSKTEAVRGEIEAGQERNRRRRSESLQREDEEAMMAELAAEAEGQDVKNTVKTLEPVAGETGYDSDGSYEYVEVTDDEGEEGARSTAEASREAKQDEEMQDAAPVEFGEDDIAYQLAAMGEDYGLDPEDYGGAAAHDLDGDDADAGWPEENDHGLPISPAEAAALFRTLLDDHNISPFTPWETLIASSNPSSILADDRYLVLPTTQARKTVWEAWVRARAAQIKDERAKTEKVDPRITYLAFLQEKATPKLYWPEFKRKFRKEGIMGERALGDRERERLYRELVGRMKLPESARKGDLIALLKDVPRRELNRGTGLEGLPQRVLAHLHFVGLPVAVRDRVVMESIAGLPPAPEADDEADEDHAQEDRSPAERRRREEALAERRRLVDEERRRLEKAERFAKRELREGEAELERAMAVPGKGTRSVMGQP